MTITIKWYVFVAVLDELNVPKKGGECCGMSRRQGF